MMRSSLHITILIVAFVTASCGSGASSKCKPDCNGKVCGDDGCGGVCGECADDLSCTLDSCKNGQCSYSLDPNYCVVSGSCVPSGTLNPSNGCQKCAPATSSKGWTSEANGVVCGNDAFCFDGQCCDKSANCLGRVCGDDGCGGQCGQCGQFEECDAKGQCIPIECEGTCEGKDCGDDGCGHVCGTCPEGRECQAGACICMPKCAGKECGDDGCGGKCGVCSGINKTCANGLCVCAGEQCGTGCCGPDQVCIGDDYCCKPQCEGRECGGDECGGSCGTCTSTNANCIDGKCVCPGVICPSGCCLAKEVCDLSGTCCLPDCEGKECGDDGCGAVCGFCSPGQLCLTGVCPPFGWICDDGNDDPWDGCTEGQLSEFSVNSWTQDSQQMPSVSSWSDGRFVVVWESYNQDAVGWGIFGQRYSSDAKPLGSEFRVNAYQTDDQRNPDVAALAGGRYAVVWDSFGQETGAGVGKGVYLQLYNSEGSKFGDEINVNSFTTGDQYNPSVAGFDNGSFVVVWEGITTDGKGGLYWDEVYFQLFDPDGNKIGDTTLVNSLRTNVQGNADVAVLGDGRFLVAFQSLNQDGDNYGVYYRLFESNGTAVADAQPLNTTAVGAQQKPAVAALSDGRCALAWESLGQDGDGGAIILRVLNADGTTISGEILVNSWFQAGQLAPSVAALPEGAFVVAWESREQDGSMGGIFAQRFDSNLSKPGDEVPVNYYTETNQWHPAIAGQGEDNYVVVWDGGGQDADLFGIFARRFSIEDDQALYH